MRNLGLRAVDLCLLAALALMAFASASAQAEPTSYWELLNAGGTLLKVGVPEDKLLPSLGASLENKTGILLTKIAGVKVEILCTAIELEEAKLLLEGKILGKVKFTGCIMKLNGVTSVPCEPHTGTEKGVILTLRLKGLIELHSLFDKEGHEIEKDDIVMVLDDKEPFPNEDHFVTFEFSKECAIGSKIPIFGKVALEDCLKLFLKHEVEHLWQEFKALTELWVISKTAEHAATLDGSGLVFLTGEHKGLKWAGVPG